VPTPTPKQFLTSTLVATWLVTGAQDLRADDSVIPLRQPDPIADYLAAIDRAEADDSAYSADLADLYLGLGKELVEAQKFEEARDAFHNGAQIARVNFGLDAPEQVNYLLAIADLDIRQGNWQDADELMRNAFMINVEGNAGQPPAQLAALQHMLDWYHERHVLMPPPGQYRAMIRAEQITQHMARIAERDLGLGSAETANLYRRVGRLNYFLADFLSFNNVYAGGAFTMSTSSAPPISRWEGQQTTISSHFNNGEMAFQKVADSLAADANATPVERAEALAQLGDWYLTFSKYRTASDAYGRAWQVLAEAGQADAAQVYFGEPTPVRFLRVKPLVPGEQDAMPPQGIDVSMTVTKAGKTRDVEFLESVEHLPKEQVHRIRKQLSSLRFRPRVHQGEVVDTPGFPWRYDAPEPKEQA